MDRIRQWLEKPDTMGTEAVSRLPELIAQYPYCTAYRLLYVIALANVHSTQMPDELRRAAAWLPDRMRLFRLVNKGEYEWLNLMERLEQKEKKKGRTENDFDLIERFLEQMRFEGDEAVRPAADDASSPIATALQDMMTPSEYDLGALAAMPRDDEEEDGPAAAREPDETDSLIDSFLEAEAGGCLFVPQVQKPERTDANDPPLNLETIRETAFLTESLAKIYIKQHKYEQALEIIRDLNLKYPKKNTYFADQIRFLETVLRYQKGGAEDDGDGQPNPRKN